MLEPDNLRPLESVIVKMRDDGLSNKEIADRIGRKPETVDRYFEMIDHKSDLPEQKETESSGKRPVEKVVNRLREEGESYEQIGNRLNKSGDHVQRIETYAEIKEDL
jgi:DNA-binding CsgD family transcriptional regulator